MYKRFRKQLNGILSARDESKGSNSGLEHVPEFEPQRHLRQAEYRLLTRRRHPRIARQRHLQPAPQRRAAQQRREPHAHEQEDEEVREGHTAGASLRSEKRGTPARVSARTRAGRDRQEPSL